MARPKNIRKVVAPPEFKGYKPYGTNLKSKGEVSFLYEEYEAIKLSDYDGLIHEEASKIMGVSRATFARIYSRARQKIATAMVEVKEINMQYGNTLLEHNWFYCSVCQSKFTVPDKQFSQHCPLCQSSDIKPVKN